MASEQLMQGGGGHRYFPMQSEASPATMPSHWQGSAEPARMFDELPKATIVSVSRPDVSDISPMLLSYTIECQYKQVPSSCLLWIFKAAIACWESCFYWLRC